MHTTKQERLRKNDNMGGMHKKQTVIAIYYDKISLWVTKIHNPLFSLNFF